VTLSPAVITFLMKPALSLVAQVFLGILLNLDKDVFRQGWRCWALR
jgi:hypothetical protein